ncbi:MAG: type II CAAX endopeptidase family protein [bacterium]|nr:type II CAAX endopeptidase family protein [bacterium]
MEESSGNDHPLQKLRLRNLLLWMLLTLPVLILCLIFVNAQLPERYEDAIGFILFALWSYLIPLIWMLQNTKRAGLSLQTWLGEVPPNHAWLPTLAIVLPLIAFSIGSFWILFYPLSFAIPDYVVEKLSTPQIEFVTSDRSPFPGLHNALLIVITVVLAPLVEELFFRGLLLPRLGLRWNTPKALVVSACIFGALHISILGLTMVGFVFGIAYLRSRTLWIPIVLHITNNAVAMFGTLIFFLTVGTQKETFTLETFQSSLWIGVLCLIFSVPWLVVFLHQNWAWVRAPLPDLQPPKRPE